MSLSYCDIKDIIEKDCSIAETYIYFNSLGLCKHCNNSSWGLNNCFKCCENKKKIIEKIYKNYINGKFNFILGHSYKTDFWHKSYKNVYYDKKGQICTYKKSVDYDLRRLLDVRIRQTLKKNRKTQSTMELVGCSIDFLKNYLQSKFESGMSWSNHGKNGWHIDHIIPCSSFDLKIPEQQKKCYHYTNLQPLWASDNLKKGSKILTGGTE